MRMRKRMKMKIEDDGDEQWALFGRLGQHDEFKMDENSP